MTEEKTIEQYQEEIQSLKQELEQTKKDNNFDELKTKYENIIEEKNQTITNLETDLEKTKKKVNETVDTLNDEVQAKLDANEEYQKLLASVKELELEKAETTVDTYIKKGIILPKQRETAIKLCLNDNDTFTDLYKDAKPIVNVEEKKSNKINSLAKGLSYFDE